jgi:SAM-dependent methyltransferase
MERLDAEGRLHYSKTGYVRQKKYLDEAKGVPVQDIWDDIPALAGAHSERLGYPTQKPLALLERIISASSNPGDLVLDPFCGCGTAVAAAQKLGRQWIGIDITYLAVRLIEQRLKGFSPPAEYEVVGIPKDTESARDLALRNRYQFQLWALGLIPAQPIQEKKGADRGMDGIALFVDEANRPSKTAIVQVKSGHVNVTHIRDLCGVVEREKAALGLMITLEEPTQPMITEAAVAGYYHSPGWNRDYSRIQIRTIAQLMAGQAFELPPSNVSLPQAEQVRSKGPGQQKLM